MSLNRRMGKDTGIFTQWIIMQLLQKNGIQKCAGEQMKLEKKIIPRKATRPRTTNMVPTDSSVGIGCQG